MIQEGCQSKAKTLIFILYEKINHSTLSAQEHFKDGSFFIHPCIFLTCNDVGDGHVSKKESHGRRAIVF
jgi:hypothetical protein